MKVFLRRGFTLIELLIVISIMGILAAVLLANMANSAKLGRDAERKSNLRNLQNAIEAYKHTYGRYPEVGCGVNPADYEFAHESNCVNYIEGASINGSVKAFVPKFIDRLPHDPSLGSNQGYSYITNPEGTVYKIMAMNTVEADTLDYTSPFKSCDIGYGGGSTYPNGASDLTVNTYGWCSYINPTGVSGDKLFDSGINAPKQCRKVVDGGNTRFEHSYGLWGGFLPLTYGLTPNARGVWQTTQVICQ